MLCIPIEAVVYQHIIGGGRNNYAKIYWWRTTHKQVNPSLHPQLADPKGYYLTNQLTTQIFTNIWSGIGVVNGK